MQSSCPLYSSLTERDPCDNDPGQSVWQDWPVKEPPYQGLEGEVVSLTVWHTGNLVRNKVQRITVDTTPKYNMLHTFVSVFRFLNPSHVDCSHFPNCQVKALLGRGVSGDVYGLADALLAQVEYTSNSNLYQQEPL